MINTGKNLLSLQHLPIENSAGIDFNAQSLSFNDVRITANLNKQAWTYGAWSLPVSKMRAGEKYTFYYSHFSGNHVDNMLISVDCIDNVTKNRHLIMDLINAEGGSVTFIYEPENYHNYQIKLFMSRGDEYAYFGHFDGTYHDLYLAQEENFSGFEPFPSPNIQNNNPNELKIINNQILDGRRQETIEGIFNQIVGTKFSPFNVETIGLCYYELGDVISIESSGKIYNCPIFNYSIDFTGGVKERLFLESPGKTNTDFKRVGDHLRKIYNTELAVDKQKQQIQSLVEEQVQQNNEISSNFSQILQMVDNITQSVQKAGGINLIKNSVGFGKDSSGKLLEWQYDGSVISISSPDSVSNGAISGNTIKITGTALKQKIILGANKTYTLSYFVKKGLSGNAKVKIYNDINSVERIYLDQTNYDWTAGDMSLYSEQEFIWVEVSSDEGVELSITDLMLCLGDQKKAWQQANGEIYNTQVSLNERGLKVVSSTSQGDFVTITPQEFAGYSNASGSSKKVFTLNRDTTEAEKILVRREINMPPLRLVPFNSGQNKGWAIMTSTTQFNGENN